MKLLNEHELKVPEEEHKNVNISSILKEIAEFKGWEIIFKFLLFGFISWGVYALYLVYEFHRDPQFADVKKFSIRDFKYSILPTLVFYFYKRACLKLFKDYVKRNLDTTKFPTEEERESRAIRGAIWLSHIIYYTFTSVLAYFLFKDTFFFPTYVGGSAVCSDIYKFTPYVPHIPYAVAFYQMQFGWHFHTLIDHVVYKWRDPKFWEMFLHHSVAVFLIFFSYLSNQVPVGILVLLTHDPCDVGLYGSRFYNDRKGKSKTINVLIYVSFVLSWLYLRLFVFPKCLVGYGFIGFFAYPKDLMYTVHLYLLVMLCALVALHLYWFIIMLRIIIDLIIGAADPNVYDKSRKSN